MAVRELPEELIEIILSKLPVKSLLRFKCVRKSWYSLIKSPHFIDLHLKNRSSAGSKYDYLILRRFLEQHHNRHVLSFYSYETLDDLCIDIGTPFSMREYSVNVSGPCNGLLCITNNREIFICNPATREFRSLVVPPLFGPDKMTHETYSVAFGLDPITGDYKVVRIVVHYYVNDDEDCYSDDPDAIVVRKLEVYDFTSDSWRETSIVLPDPFCLNSDGISLNGAFHWHLTLGHGGESVLSFHISNEVTQLIPLPDFCSRQHPRRRNLDVLNESLALIVYDRDQRYEIWVMTEYGVKESWTRLFELGPLSGIQFPLTFWKNDELLLQTNNRQLVSCNLQHQNIKRFPIYAVTSLRGTIPFFGVVPYSESLISVYAINVKDEFA
ncbi:hypothetical protein OROHE_003800 [Orobanche hederae]